MKTKNKKELSRKKKIFIIISSIVLFLFLFYFVGSVSAILIVSHTLFDKRMSNVEDLKTNYECNIYKTREDYDCLKEREIINFQSEDNTLTGYLYLVDNPKALVITSHGFNSQADSVDSEYYHYFVNNGFDVFAFDLTAAGRSEGKKIKGLSQAAYDYKAAIDYLRSDLRVNKLDFCLLGYSLSGYGAAACLNFVSDIKAVCLFSNFVSPAIEMKELAKDKVGSIAKLTYWTADIGLKIRNGDKEFLSAITGINKEKDTKTMIIQGSLDTIIPLASSMYGNRTSITNKNVMYKYLEGRNHRDVYLSDESISYYHSHVDIKYQELVKKYKKFNDVPEDEKLLFYSQIDKEKTSQLNVKLFNEIKEMFIS